MNAVTLSRKVIIKSLKHLLAIVSFGAAFQYVQAQQPELLDIYFDEGVSETVGESEVLSGQKGNQRFQLYLKFTTNILWTSFGDNDLEIVGVGGSIDGVALPFRFAGSLLEGEGEDQARVARYEIGPLDSSQNGDYSVRVVENAIGGGSQVIPPGEILKVTQDITDPVPEVLGVHSFEVDGDAIAPQGEAIVIEGPYGYSTATFKIDYNLSTATFNIGFEAIEIVGPGGESMRANPSDWVTLEDRKTVTYLFGRLDSAKNGEYTIRAKEGLIPAIGEGNDPATLPAGDLFTFNQNITDPAPRVLQAEDFSFPIELFPIVTDNFMDFTVYYNLAVDIESLDKNDITITGISPENEGQVLTIEEFFNSNVRVQDSVYNDGYITVTYSILGPLREEFNGDWKVEINEGQVRSKSDPELFVPAGEIGTFKQAVVDPFVFTIEGRIYTEKEGTTPSLTDDGWEIDPGLLNVGARLETPPNGGIGYQNIGFPFPTIIYDELETGLSPEIVEIRTLDGENTGFIIAENKTNGEFPLGSTFTIEGSSGNNGTYTVQWTSLATINSDEGTIIQVEEEIKSDIAGGRIMKGPFVSEISIDGTVYNASFMAEDIPTFEDLLTKLNDLFEGNGFISKTREDQLRIESCTYGPESTVLITEPEDGTGLFANFGAFPSEPVDGNLDWESGFRFNNDYFNPSGVEDESDWGRIQFGGFSSFESPGIYRIRLIYGFIDTGEKDEFGDAIFEEVPPPLQIGAQALGDPFREGEPKDHTMYLQVKRDMKGETITVNFSYFPDNEPPHLMHDEIQVLGGSSGSRLDVLANDGRPAGNNDDLTIVGLGLWPEPSFLFGDVPTELTTNSQQRGNRSWTDGEYVYYDSPGFLYELFYYIVEDSEGRRDWTEIYIEPVFELVNQFSANDDFATFPVTASRIKINVLANDSVENGISKDQLVITEITTPTAGGTVTFSGTDVTYFAPPNFLGTDTFQYTMTDNVSGTDTATVNVSVNELPHSLQREALLRLVLKHFKVSGGGGLIAAFFINHISEFNYIMLDQGGNSVSPKARGKLPLSRLQTAGTADSQAQLNALLDLAEPALIGMATGQGDSGTISQELVNSLMAVVTYVEERGSPDLVADLQELCEMTNDFQDLVGKTFNESAVILGLDPENISIPNLALEKINNVLSITTWDVVGVAYKLWKSNTLQPDSWVEVEDVEVEAEGLKAKISDPDVGDEDVFYRLTGEIEQ